MGRYNAAERVAERGRRERLREREAGNDVIVRMEAKQEAFAKMMHEALEQSRPVPVEGPVLLSTFCHVCCSPSATACRSHARRAGSTVTVLVVGIGSASLAQSSKRNSEAPHIVELSIEKLDEKCWLCCQPGRTTLPHSRGSWYLHENTGF